MVKKALKAALYVVAVAVALYALADLKSAVSGPEVTLEQAKRYAKELSGDVNHPPIILFYTTWCPACKAVQQFMDEKKIPYIAAEIEQNLAAQYFFNELTNGKSSAIPVTVVGTTAIVGYKPWTILDAVEDLESKTYP